MIRPSLVVAHIALDFYHKDILMLVKNGAKVKIDKLSNSDDPADLQEAKD